MILSLSFCTPGVPWLCAPPNPLTDSGGTVGLFATLGAVGHLVDTPTYSSFYFANGFGTASSPEPGSLSVIVLGGAVLCALGRKKVRTRQRLQ